MAKKESKLNLQGLRNAIDLAGSAHEQEKTYKQEYDRYRKAITPAIEELVGIGRVVEAESYKAILDFDNVSSISVSDFLAAVKTPALRDAILSVNLTKAKELLEPVVIAKLVTTSKKENPTLRISKRKDEEVL